MEQQKNFQFNGEQFLEIYEGRLQDALYKYGIGQTGKLATSFVRNVISDSGGNVANLQLKFLFYGRFRDMNVGSGSSLGDQHQSNKDKVSGKFHRTRKVARWYSKTTTREVAILAKLLEEQFGVNMIRTVEDSLPGDQVIIEI